VNSKKKVQEELEEYKEKFNVDETTKVMLTPYEYPNEVAREIQLKLEAERIRRQIEFDRLEADRERTLNYNKEQIKRQKFEMVKETQELNKKIEEDYSNYMEVDVREQFLIDERLAAYRKMMETNRAE
jgi:hypothetical protein